MFDSMFEEYENNVAPKKRKTCVKLKVDKKFKT